MLLTLLPDKWFLLMVGSWQVATGGDVPKMEKDPNTGQVEGPAALAGS